MTTIPPDVAEIDKWLTDSGADRLLISRSFLPGKGFHVSACVVGFTTNTGSHQFAILTGNPTTDPITANALRGLTQEYGEITLRGYEYHEPQPQIAPSGMAAGDNIQSQISDMDNWAGAASRA